MESRKMVPMKLLAGRNGDTEQTHMDTGSGEGGGVGHGDSNTDTDILRRTGSQLEFAA